MNTGRSSGRSRSRSRSRGRGIRDRLSARARDNGAGAHIPLSGLRERLDAGSAQAHWDLDINGIPGRALVAPAGPPVAFPLRLAGPVRVRGQVRLILEDWRNGNGAVRAWIAAQVSTTERVELWSAQLGTSEGHADPDGFTFSAEVPLATEALLLGVQQVQVIDGRSIGRVIWVDVELVDPALVPFAAPLPPVPSHSAATILGAVPGGSRPPRFSILTPVHNPPVAMLQATIASVLAQSFGDWELCLVDDGSTVPEVIEVLERHAAAQARIRLIRHETAGGISAATNAALGMATGEFVVLLDHDDTLDPDALALVQDRLLAEPELDMIYSDEGVVDERQRIARILKPGWSPERMLAAMYTCHLGVYRRTLAQEIGGFDPAFDGCQDYDFVLRVAERTDRIAHIPAILYHWRAHASSTAGGDQAKPYAYVAQPRAIAGHLERRGAAGVHVQFGSNPGIHRIVYPADPAAAVTIVLPVTAADAGALGDAAASWLAQPHAHWSVLLAGPPSALRACTHALREADVPDPLLTTCEVPSAGGPGHALAIAASRAASGGAERLLLLQAPMIGITHDWLGHLLGASAQDGIAAAGGLVLTPDGRIVEAGIAIPGGLPMPLLHGRVSEAASAVAANLSALSGAILTGRDTLHRLGGLHGECGDLVLVDYTLRAHAAGLRNVLLPDVRLRLTGGDYIVNDLAGLRHLTRGPGGDPFYNPNYRTDRADYTPLVRD